MNILCLLVCIAGCTAGGPAAASWLRCSASGTDRSGEFADFTTVVDVGAITQAQRQAMQQRLVTYVTKVDPEASGVHGECSVSDDQVQAAAIYSRTPLGLDPSLSCFADDVAVRL